MDIFASIKPVLCISKILCLLPFEYDVKNKSAPFKSFARTKLYNLRMFAILTLITGFVVYKQVSASVYDSNSSIANTITFVHLNGHLVVAISCLLLMNYYNAKIVDFMNTLCYLNVNFENLGRKVDYKMILRISYFAVVTFVLKVIVIAKLSFTIHENSNSFLVVTNFSVLILPLFLTHTTCLHWILYLLLLKLQLKSLKVVVKGFNYTECFVIVLEPFLLLTDVLERNRELYRRLCVEAKSINDAFSWQFLVTLPCFFVKIVLDSFNICRSIKQQTALEASTVTSNIIHSLVVVEIIVSCVLVKEEFDKLVDAFNNVALRSDYNLKEVDELVCSVLLQLDRQRIEFSVYGIFSLDGTFMHTILAALTTYLIILLQFDA